MPPIRKPDRKWARNNLQKANIFAEHLKTRFHLNEGDDALLHLNSNNYLDKIPLVTPKEVADEVKKNPNAKKAPGYDLVTGETLKRFQKKILLKLTTLINACIRLNYVPDAWKTAKAIIIPELGKNLGDVKSYRPILLLPLCLSCSRNL